MYRMVVSIKESQIYPNILVVPLLSKLWFLAEVRNEKINHRFITAAHPKGNWLRFPMNPSAVAS